LVRAAYALGAGVRIDLVPLRAHPRCAAIRRGAGQKAIANDKGANRAPIY
jgi:hypothetical protein